MEKKFLEITTLSDEDGREMFKILSEEVLGMDMDESKKLLGIPKNIHVGIKDTIELIKELKVQVRLRVDYEAKPVVLAPEEPAVSETPEVVAETTPAATQPAPAPEIAATATINVPADDDLPSLD